MNRLPRTSRTLAITKVLVTSPTRGLHLLLVAAIAFGVACGRKDAGDDISACNLHKELCDRALNKVAFATTHNSMSNVPDHWIDATQSSGISEQLKAGIRGFQLDSYYGVKVGPRVLTSVEVRTDKMSEQLSESAVGQAAEIASGIGDIVPGDRAETYLCHGNCELGAVPMVKALQEFTTFLEANPNEVLIIFIEDYISGEDTAAAFEEAGLTDYVYTYQGGEWPTLRKMIDDGTRILVMSEHGGGDPAWYHNGFELTQETPYSFASADDLLSDTSCDPNRGEAESPLFQLNHFISPADPDTSAKANEFQLLLDRALKCKQERGLVPNLVAVNFWGEGSVVDVVDEINGVAQ